MSGNYKKSFNHYENNYFLAYRDISRILVKVKNNSDFFKKVINILDYFDVCRTGWMLFTRKKGQKIVIAPGSFLYHNRKIKLLENKIIDTEIPLCCLKSMDSDFKMQTDCSSSNCEFLGLQNKLDPGSGVLVSPIKSRQNLFGFFAAYIPLSHLESEIVIEFIKDLSHDTAFFLRNADIHKQRLENESKYKTLFANLPVGIYSINDKGAVKSGNEKFFNIIKYSGQTDKLKINISSLYSKPEDFQKILSMLEKNGFIENYESEMIDLKGNKFWVNENAHSLITESDKQIYEFSIEDITARKKNTEELARRARWLEILNTLAAKIALKNDFKSITNIIFEFLKENFDFSAMGIAFFGNEYRDYKFVEFLSDKVNFPKISKKYFRVISDYHSFLFCDSQRICYYDIENFNRNKTGLEEDDLFMLLSANNISRILLIPLFVEKKLTGFLFMGNEVKVVLNDAESFFLTSLSEYISIAGNNTRLYEKIQNSYEQLKKAQNSVKEQESLKAMGQVASGITHDINNILSPITLYTEALISTEKNISEKGVKYLKNIKNAVTDIEKITQRLRSFYRKDIESDMEKIFLTELFEDVFEICRMKIDDASLDKGIRIYFVKNIHDEKIYIIGIKSEIRESIVNCIFNSVDAMIISGTITLEGSRDNGNVIISVRDSGKGMSDQERMHCLEPFYTTKGKLGTGLGLSGVFGMVSRHDGELEISSAAGEGTEIIIKFPLREEKETFNIKSINYRLKKKLNILCVDDDYRILNVLKEILMLEGHSVTVYDNPMDAIKDVSDNFDKMKYDIVFTDLGMAEMNGYDFAEKIKKIFSSLPVVLLSGWSSHFRHLDEDIGVVDAVIEKPPTMKMINKVLSDLFL